MKTKLSRMLAVMVAATLGAFMSPAAAFIIELEFIENEAGLTITETSPGFLVTLSLPGAESHSLFDRDGDGWMRLGRSGTTTLIFNLTEPGTGLISDQVTIGPATNSGNPCTPPGCNTPSLITFTSDNDLGTTIFDLGTPTTTVVEDGTRQLVGSYIDNAGNTVNVYIQSEVDGAAPAPATVALLALGLAGLGFSMRKPAQVSLRND